MKCSAALVTALLFFPCSLTAQSACRQAAATVLQRGSNYTAFSVPLPSRPKPFTALALIPNGNKSAGAYVFTLSKIVRAKPAANISMLPVAIELVSHGRPTMVLQRVLKWPEGSDHAMNIEQDVLCAEQWLSTHAAVDPEHWGFIGPLADIPRLEQLRSMGDTTSMIFWWGFPLGDTGERERRNTESLFRVGKLSAKDLPDHE